MSYMGKILVHFCAERGVDELIANVLIVLDVFLLGPHIFPMDHISFFRVLFHCVKLRLCAEFLVEFFKVINKCVG